MAHECDLSVLTDGPLTAPLLIVGQSPGSEEVAAGSPFVGLSGRILWKSAADFGLLREHSLILNASCQVPSGGTSKAAPTAKQLAECRPAFEDLLRRSSPRIILTLGGTALRAISGADLRIDNCRGYLLAPSEAGQVKRPIQVVSGAYKLGVRCGHWSGKGKKAVHEPPPGDSCDGWARPPGAPKYKSAVITVQRTLPASVEWILPTYHPAAVHYMRYTVMPAFRQDLERCARALRGEATPLEISFSVGPVPLEGAALAFDLETTMDGRAILAIGLASDSGCWTSPWDWRAAGAAREALGDPRTVKVAHNASFDLDKLMNYQIPVRGELFDTMLAFQLVQPDLFKGLGRVASVYFDLRRWKHLESIDPNLYNASDAFITHKLYRTISDDLVSSGQDKLFRGTLMPALSVLIGMKRRGILCSDTRLVAWRTRLLRKRSQYARLWAAQSGGVDPASNRDVADLLYKRLGMPVQTSKGAKGASGSISVDDGALVRLLGRGHDPLLRCLRALRKNAKLQSTYAKDSLGYDNRVHPNYLPGNKEDDEHRKGSTGSGRLAASEPNIQNQPQVARRIYVPSAGMVFLEADAGQAEIRVAAFSSGDRAMLRALEGDVHEAVRAQLGCDRVRAKNVLFGTIYGAGPRSLVDILRRKGVTVSVPEMTALQRRLAAAYPALWSWRESLIAQGRAQGYLTNAFGRRRYFYWASEQGPEMVDYIPQSTVADVLWASFLPLSDAITSLGGHLVTTVHDSVLVEIPRLELYPASRALTDILGREFPQVAPGFRLPVDLKWSPTSWGEMEPLCYDPSRSQPPASVAAGA